MTNITHMKMPDLRESVVLYNARLRSRNESTIDLNFLSNKEAQALLRSSILDLSPENLARYGQLSQVVADAQGHHLTLCIEQLRRLVDI